MGIDRSYVVSLQDFAGVDYSSSLLNVADKRAVNIKNFLNINNNIQKRKGFTQKINIKNTKINGIWEFTASDNKNYVIAHAGTNLYILNFEDGIYGFSLINKGEIDTIEDKLSDAISNNNRLYIFCGDLVVVYHDGKEIKVKRVQDDVDTTIPTTTITITEEGSYISSRKALDDVNMMTKWRINSLKSHTLPPEKYEEDYIVNEKNPVVFYLDGAIHLDYLVGIENGQYINVNTPILTINYLDENGNAKTQEFSGTPAGQLINIRYEFKDSENNIIGILTNRIVTHDNSLVAPSYFPYKNAILYLYKDYIPITDAEDNITIKYDGSYGAGAEKINKCTICKVYGYGGNADTLFASGNVDYPNVVFHTNNTAKKDFKTLEENIIDFTYWSDLDYNILGTKNSAITSMEITGDGILCCLKNEAINEPNAYFIKAEYINATTYDGLSAGEGLLEVSFTATTGVFGESPFLNDKTFRNLNGDSIFISKNGLFGVSISSNLNSTQRFSYSRSRVVNNRLTKENLENSFAIVYDNKYWLGLKDTGTVYVFDGRFKFQLEDDLSSDFNYECFVLDNIYARGFAIIGNKLYYYTEKGGIFEYLDNSNTYYDTHIDQIDIGESTFDVTTQEVIWDEEFVDILIESKNEEGKLFISSLDKLSIVTDIYNQTFNVYSKEDDTNFHIQIIKGNEYKYTHKDIYKLGVYTLSGTLLGEIDISYNDTLPIGVYKCTLSGITVNDIINNESGIKLALTINDEYLYSEIDQENKNIITYWNNTEVKLFQPEVIPIAYSYFEFKKNVECYFETKLFNFGTSIFTKTISSLTLTGDFSLKSSCQFGYRTKNQFQEGFMFRYGDQTGIDYSNYDLTNIDYDPVKDFAMSFTMPTKIRNFNYIQFLFKNNENSNCVLSNLSIVYSQGQRKRGIH